MYMLSQVNDEYIIIHFKDKLNLKGLYPKKSVYWFTTFSKLFSILMGSMIKYSCQ